MQARGRQAPTRHHRAVPAVPPALDAPPRGRRLPRRLLQLYAGLVLYGLSIALLVRSALGLMPWSVLDQGIARSTGLSLGSVTVLVGAVVLLAWVPLRQRPGVGTVSNVLVIGLALDASLAVLPDVDHLAARLVQLYAGLALYGLSIALLVQAHLGLMPWSVLDQGISRSTGLSLGTVSILVGVVVLLSWVPLRQRPGIGTVSNVLVIGLALDASLAVLPDVDGLPLRLGLLVVGVVLNALATAAYIGVHLGPGPRDGLMTGLVRRTGGSVRLVRTGIEVVVVLLGVILGGTLGVGTVLYALTIGPLVQLLLPRVTVPLR